MDAKLKARVAAHMKEHEKLIKLGVHPDEDMDMPAKSEKQRRYFAMCHENPKKGGCPKGMTREQMHDFMYRAPHNPVKKGTTHGAAKNLGIPKGPKNKGTTKAPYSSKNVASSIMKRMHRPRGG